METRLLYNYLSPPGSLTERLGRVAGAGSLHLVAGTRSLRATLLHFLLDALGYFLHRNI